MRHHRFGGDEAEVGRSIDGDAGEGLEWGLLFAFGPGLTVETILLRALPSNKALP
jgi:hypothetical protein